MPTIMLPLPEVHESVVRPVVFSVIDDIKKITNINIPTPIYLPGDVRKMQQTGSSIDGDTRDPVLASQRQLFVEVEEDFHEDYIASVGALYNPEHPPIFVDPILGVTVVPVYVMSTIKIQLKFKSQSKTEAIRWRDDIIVKSSRLRNQNLHSVRYHYSMPEVIEDILYAIYERREGVEGYGQSVTEYIMSNASNRLTLVADVANKSSVLAIKETQSRIVGLYDFEIAPEKTERDENTGSWISTMAYSFSYNRPTEMSIKYPVIVHNQLMPEKYTTYVFDTPSLDTSMKRHSQSLYALSMFESPNLLDNTNAVKPPLHIPEFDLYEPKVVPYGTLPIFIALCCLDLPNKRYLMNIKEIDPFTIDKRVLDYILAGEHTKITKPYASVYQLQLLKDDDLCIYETIECDALGNVTSKVDLSPRHTYRILFSVVTDASLLPPGGGGVVPPGDGGDGTLPPGTGGGGNNPPGGGSGGGNNPPGGGSGGGNDDNVKTRKTIMLQSVIAYRKSDLERP